MRFFVFLWGKGWEWGEKRKKSLTNNGKKVRLSQAFFVCLAQTARGWVRMLIAYNNDIEFRSRWYHIQTEDNGIKDGHVTTTVFFSGQILDSKTTSYLDAINGITDVEEQNRIIKNVMTTQHKLFYAKLYEGQSRAQGRNGQQCCDVVAVGRSRFEAGCEDGDACAKCSRRSSGIEFAPWKARYFASLAAIADGKQESR